jgi:NAD(P)-dependent dehydrogenase (short-subunit alcohol dehydrogenase family)
MEPASAPRLVEEIAGHFGRIDILVNAIGDCVSREGFVDYDDANWEYHFESVLMTTVRMCREVLPLMKRQGGGAILNIVSQSTHRYYDKMVSYAAMKASVAHITKNMAREFASSGIRVNAIRAGWILSESQRAAIDERKPPGRSDAEFFKELQQYWHDVSWSDRFGTLEEIGDSVAFLCSERASYVNGAWLQVDGGSL